MKRANLPASVGGRWDGLALDVDRPARPGLRVEVAAGRRLLLRQRNEIVLLGSQRARRRGVYYARTGRYRSPLPALTTVEARRIRQTVGDGDAWAARWTYRFAGDGDAWAARWTYRFAGWLNTALDGPLHCGRWTMTPGMPAWSVRANWRRLHAVDPDRGHITWFGYGDPEEDVRDVLPLRRLSPMDADRVKSYRRQLGEGMMPPVLLWWVSGLDTLLVLDGHDRITAALAEDAVPDVVVLAPAADPAWVSMLQRAPIRQYEANIERLPEQRDRDAAMAAVRLANTTRRFAQQLDGIARTPGPTRAWPVPGGRAAWDRYATQQEPGWTAADPTEL